MIRFKLFAFFILQVMGMAFVVGIDLSKVNLAYQYDPDSGIRFAHRVVDAGDSIAVIYQVITDTINHWEQAFLLQDGYNSLEHDTLRTFRVDTLAIEGGVNYFRLSFLKQAKPLLLIAWFDRNRGVFRIEDVRVTSPVGFPAFYPVAASGLPLLQNYVNGNELELSGETDRFHAYEYSEDFGPADPAMGRMRAIAPSLEIDSSFFFNGQLTLEAYHFYLIQTDSLAQNGVTLLSCPSYYPAQRRIEELVPPLTYLTTDAEIRTLTGKMNKSSFESFWVNTYGSRFRAKSAIKNFYNRIETVNDLFTDYKQGWQTDRGVIYLIFGKPDKVFRSERSEIWRYINGTEFEFIRISTLFATSMYTLKRDRSYEQIWYNQVGELRKGM